MLFAFATLITALSASAASPSLGLPVDCILGTNCFIQNYVDIDNAAGSHHDYRCGHMSYDGHKGTDFRTRNLVQMRQGVNVIAPADGTVLRVRDSMPDISIRHPNAPPLNGNDCGNGLVIAHAGGFETQYCHLKQNSLRVVANQEVTRGQVLGQIGLSGRTEFPHLHFGLRDKHGNVIDPFSGLMHNTSCNNTAQHTNLWHPTLHKQLAYAPTQLLSAGFSSKRPQAQQARNGAYATGSLAPNTDPLIFWVDIMGLKQDDELVMQIINPKGVSVVNHSQTIDRNKALLFQFVGSRKRESNWIQGSYSGYVQVNRNGKPVLSAKKLVGIVEPSTKKEASP